MCWYAEGTLNTRIPRLEFCCIGLSGKSVEDGLGKLQLARALRHYRHPAVAVVVPVESH